MLIFIQQERYVKILWTAFETGIFLKKYNPDHVKKDSFAGIKNTLDASSSYIVFENDLIKASKSIFSDDIPIGSYLEKEGYSWQKVLDTNLSREYLVIQFKPGNEDEILGKVMGYGLPEDTVYYLFKAKENWYQAISDHR